MVTTTAQTRLSPHSALTGHPRTVFSPSKTNGKLVRAKVLLGKTTPRMWTPALRKLTPTTSRGFACIAFADSLGIALDPWQRWLLTHALEINPDGSYRFRVVIVIVGRQNGKTTITKLLALWRMIDQPRTTVLGTSTNLEYAKEAFEAAVETAQDHDEQAPAPWVLKVGRASTNIELRLRNGSRYKIASAGRRGGRSLSVDLGIADELREHPDWSAWAAMSGTVTARPNPQIWGLSNAGDYTAVVLNHFRDAAHTFIASGEGDDTLGLFEWSAKEDADILDRRAWAQANPSLGIRITEATLEGKSKLPAEVFKIEHLCIGVATANPVVDQVAWAASGDTSPFTDAQKRRTVLAIDVAPDFKHVSLLAGAATDDGRVKVETVAAWDSTDEARRELAAIVAKIRPRALGWFPNGPASALKADIEAIKCSEEISDVQSACQGFAEQVQARRILHSEDPMLTGQVVGASKAVSGDGWRFTRRGIGHVDGAYAAAGVVHLVRTKFARTAKSRILLPTMR